MNITPKTSSVSVLILIAALLAALACLPVPIKAPANPTVSVSVVNPASQVQIASDGTANFAVSAHITFANIPEGYASQQAVHEYIIEVALGNYGESPTNSISGTIVSNPDNCGGPPSSVLGFACFITPACQFTTSSYCGGTEDISFNVVLSNAQPRQYHFEVGAEVMPNSQVIYYAYSSYADFYVEMVSSPSPEYTSPTYPAYTSPSRQPTSTTALQVSSVPPILIVILLWAAAIVVAVIVLLYFLKRSKRKGKVTQTKLDSVVIEKPTAPREPPTRTASIKPAESSETKTQTVAPPSPDMIFCNQCGARITRDSKFCKECGSKQT
ncbi:MAG: hypothetical protein ACLP5V_10735 [Candidatus Bathyarchaeia archaeon]